MKFTKFQTANHQDTKIKFRALAFHDTNTYCLPPTRNNLPEPITFAYVSSAIITSHNCGKFL